MATVWTLSRYGEDYEYVYAVFGTEEEAKASAEEGDSIDSHVVRTEALRTEYRWRATEKYRPDYRGLREVRSVKRYRVNELSEEFGAGLIRAPWDFGAHAGFSAPTRKEARDALQAEIAPFNEREQERLDYLASCTEQFRCPDHGDLGMGSPNSHLPCVPCARWVDVLGVRFGRYEHVGSGGTSFSVSATPPDADQGPLPDAERQESAVT